MEPANMKRRDQVRALFSADPAPGNTEPPAPRRAASGAVRAMGLEIDRLTEEARAAEELRRQVEGGAAVVELLPDLVDASFASDRLARTEDPDYRRLVESMRESGQQVPILVRPHPEAPGRYQIAYGHRRREAAQELGIAVKAVVRPLTDDELVVAQGKENGERRNLSYIERAMFAADLQRRGFDRATLNGALGVHTAEMTRLLSVAASVPEPIIRRIGSAPKAGRLRWQEFAREIGRPGALEALDALLDQPSIRSLPTDRRFDAIIAALRTRAPQSSTAQQEPLVIRDARGSAVLRVERALGGMRFAVDDRAAPGLGDLLLRELQSIVARYGASHR
jgi:ParB family chromosome partitioning protein